VNLSICGTNSLLILRRAIYLTEKKLEHMVVFLIRRDAAKNPDP
jgi:hypothetical protein